ncbi:hypothetical protein [Azoarcus olearius]|uniref:Uncharacterized protein n=1 Tax=Azoarcus sp. (strain BH72) TaxID=418699 RepID=A1K238_AZOSB|nr:hypothetical protein [Azoarcus olearius]CAL92893.1 Hypothetical protein azo0276 [Azoarcus olearius]
MASVPPGFKPGIANLEKAWGSSPELVGHAQWSGMDAIDLETLQEFCRAERKLLIFRAPGGLGRQVRGLGVEILPKPAAMKQKTHGRWIVQDGRLYTSDWDLLSAWQRTGNGYSRFELGADSRQTAEFLKRINRQLLFPLQHGANDDYLDEAGNARNRAIGERFIAIDETGGIDRCETQVLMKAYYATRGLAPWLYG